MTTATVRSITSDSAGAPPLSVARDAFVARDRFTAATVREYRKSLDALLAAVGDVPVDRITAAHVRRLLETRWATCAPRTWNRHRAAVAALMTWTVERGWRADNPVAAVERRTVRRTPEQLRAARPLPRAALTRLWALDGVPVRDRLLWRMAYETWARAEELLGLDVADLDVAARTAVVIGKGGGAEAVYWSTGTARVLPWTLHGRTRGPLFLAGRRPARPMPSADTDPDSGRARLSYRQAERAFAAAGARVDPTGTAWTLHRLRHAGIAHAVEDGWDLAMIRAKSRHASLRSLEVYTNPAPAAVAAMTADLDPLRRRRRRG